MNPREELRLDIRAFLDRWTPDCQPMSFREEFKRLMIEIVRECSVCSEAEFSVSDVAEIVKDAMR